MINSIVNIIKNKGLVVFPTDTVFALACDATSDDAVKKIYEAKNRDYSKPLAIFVQNFDDIKKITRPNSFLENFKNEILSGKLTVILKINQHSNLSKLINTNNDTVGIRVPNHKLTQKILKEFGKPIAATSLNLSGENEITDSKNISETLKEKIDFIVEGKSDNNKVSTIIDLTSEKPTILRKGVLEIDLNKLYNN
jgi:tRNA threonylcarbamoyl adenosine modification protein (Sua5/YciO/YrdC/YwlC family)